MVSAGGVILPKKPTKEDAGPGKSQFKVWWPDELIAEIHGLAAVSNRSIREASQMLMEWAVERAKEQYASKGIKIVPGKTENQEDQ